jgi:hypothetical protein
MPKPQNESIIWEIFSPMFGLLRGSRNKCQTIKADARKNASIPRTAKRIQPRNNTRKIKIT